jgi:16S rRNA (guanine527-N7)-methyltransferase
MAPLDRLPALSLEDFRRALGALSSEPLSAAALRALHAHYLDLSRWNRAVPLVGVGTFDEVLSRHYGESLAAIPLLPPDTATALDLGSGAGFPGFVIAAVRPSLQMTLVEARGRKWSFLESAARKASLPCRCLNVRVSAPLPAGFPQELDLVTARAIKLPPPLLAELAARLKPTGRLLLWVGEADPEVPPDLLPDAVRPLAGSERRRILSYRRTDSTNGGSP